jgi:nitrogenase molybdenum-iron protein beta chain
LNVTGPCLGLSVPSTNIQENEVVFGGIERLREEILNAVKIIEGKLYFVLTGCLPEVIGDDVESLVEELSGQGVKVVMASVAGFKGDSYHGYEEVLKTLFTRVVKPSSQTIPNQVNVWGAPPSLDPFWRGDLDGIIELLSLLGLTAKVFFGPSADFKDLTQAAKSVANIVISPLYGLEAAQIFKGKFHTPFIQTNFPIGAAAADRFLKTVGQELGLPRSQVNKAIKEAGRKHYAYLEPLIDVYNDMEAQRHALIVGEANYALALTDFFAEDLGWVPELTVITNQLDVETREKLLKAHKEKGGVFPNRLIFESQATAIAKEAKAIWGQPPGKYHNSRQPVLVAGSSLERALAAELGAAHLSLTYPIANRAILSRGYVGYSGGLRLTEDVVSAFIAGR